MNAQTKPETPPQTADPAEQDRLQSIEQQLQQLIQITTETLDTNRLWTLADVARYLSVSEMSARRIMSHKMAPKPVRLPTQKRSTTPPRYVAQEVIEFVLRRDHRGKHVVNY